jgi:hypothetical protein
MDDRIGADSRSSSITTLCVRLWCCGWVKLREESKRKVVRAKHAALASGVFLSSERGNTKYHPLVKLSIL